jgi:hypothetical protein
VGGQKTGKQGVMRQLRPVTSEKLLRYKFNFNKFIIKFAIFRLQNVEKNFDGKINVIDEIVRTKVKSPFYRHSIC